MDIQVLLRQEEGKTLEFKRDLSSPEKVLRTIVAFANTAGGVILIGIEDRTKGVSGVQDVLLEEERLTNLITDGIRPAIMPDIQALPWRRRHILAVRIHPSSSRPHYLKELGAERGAFARVGSSNRRADRALLDELRRLSRSESFDESPIPEWSSEAIDFRAASELFVHARKLSRRDLRILRLVTRHQGRLVPTIGGVILFGKRRLERVPDAWIQVGRFAGSDRARILDHQDLQSYPPRAVEDAIAFVRKHDQKRADIGAVRRSDRWGFPPEAVREAVINAVVHADYSQRGSPIRVSIFDDRLEVESPGLLPFGLTIEDIREGISKLRNRVIGRVFRELGLIEQWGSGIQRMRKACVENGLPEPFFEEVGWHFRVTIQNCIQSAPSISGIDRVILDAVGGEREGLSTKDIAAKIGRSTRATRTRLAELVGRGWLVEIGLNRRDPRRRYCLPKNSLGQFPHSPS